MNTVRYLIGDVFDRLGELEDGSIDLVVTSPPFLGLRSYLPADHPDKAKEIGSEATPAEYIDTLLAVTQELRRALAPHGSIAIELGDTYAGSGGSGGDYNSGGLREGQASWEGSAAKARVEKRDRWASSDKRPGWPLAKSKTLIPELYQIALTYGSNPLTGEESPAGLWRTRNIITWCRRNPPPGGLSDKWRPGTSDIVVACLSDKRYWDDLATRRPVDAPPHTDNRGGHVREGIDGRTRQTMNPVDENGHRIVSNPAGAPLLDWWEITAGGYKGAHYAVFPPALVEPFIKAMCPERVCLTCGEPSRRIIEVDQLDTGRTTNGPQSIDRAHIEGGSPGYATRTISSRSTTGWLDCGHDDWRPGVVLDPFAGTGTTGLVAVTLGRDAVLIDLDERNADLARERVGDSLLHTLEVVPT